MLLTMLLGFAQATDPSRVAVERMNIRQPLENVLSCSVRELGRVGKAVDYPLPGGGRAVDLRFESLFGPLGPRDVFEFMPDDRGTVLTVKFQHPRSKKSALSGVRNIARKCFRDDYNAWAATAGEKLVK